MPEPTATSALYDVLLPLCDDLPGEPPALLAWSPSRLAEVVAAGLADNGYAITREALCSRSGGCHG